MKKDTIIEISDEADKFLLKKYKKDKKLYHRILRKIDEISENPYDFEFLVSAGKWRKARVGSYRIIFTVEEDDIGNKIICLILLINHRKNIYKHFNK